MKLTEEQKSVIRAELFKNIKNDETRSKIISTAFGFAHENGEDGDIEKKIIHICKHFIPIQLDKLSNGLIEGERIKIHTTGDC